MTEPIDDADKNSQSKFIAKHKHQIVVNAVLIGLVLTIFAAPAAAQSNPLCTDDNLSNLNTIIDSIIQLAFYGGFFGSIVTYFGTTAVESAPVSEERRESLKGIRKKSFSASLKLLIGGPAIYFILNGVVGMSCITLIPW
jgi:small-conductance mechanosensitive channel